MPLGAAVCGAALTGDAASVTLHLTDDAGRAAAFTLAPSDPQGHLARINGEDCAAAAVATGATLALGPDLLVDDQDGSAVGVLELTVRPVPGGPAVTVTEIEGTVLCPRSRGPRGIPPS